MPAFIFTYTNLSIPGMYYLSDFEYYGVSKMQTIIAFWSIFPYIVILSVPISILAVPGILIVAFNQMQIVLDSENTDDYECYYLSFIVPRCKINA